MLTKKFLKEIFLWFFPFLVLISFLFIINIIKKDFVYGHYLFATNKEPYNWLYDFTVIPLKKFYISIRNDNKNYLPKVGLYLSESKRNYLLSDIPNSVKEWQRGKIIHYFDKNNLKNAQIRLRGDNPANWIREKQSFRIKLRKSEMHERQRYYNYLPFEIRHLTATRMALNSKIFAPEVKPIELFVNGEKKGLYLEVENFNENFLRRNKIMPVNFYKGENYNQETKIGLPRHLFTNPGLWSKEAYFNFYEKENKNDLKKFLKILSHSKNDSKKLQILLSYLDDEYIGRYLAYISLVQNYHQTRFHNNRLIIDTWKGQIFPVITDPGQNFHSNTQFDNATNDLISILNQTSKFIDLKYYYLNKLLFNEKIIDKEIHYLLNQKSNITNVMRNDPVLTNFIPQFFNKNKNFEIIDDTIKGLKNRKKTLMSELTRIPEIFWSDNKKHFSIILNDLLPVNNIVLTFDKDIPEWVFLDENYNGTYDDNEIKFYKNKKKIILDISLYSNRINLNDYYNLDRNNLVVNATKFNLISSNGKLPTKIEANNIFLKNKFGVVYKKENEITATKAIDYNNVIFGKDRLNKNLNTKILSGKIIVNKDLTFESPVLIKEGTTFLLEENVNLIFKNKLTAIGMKDKKIRFLRKSKKPWGTIAIIGKNTSGSKLKHMEIKDGSGSFSDQFTFTSMLSIHNTRDIELENIEFGNNHHYDDTLHVIYSSNIDLKNLFFSNANGDAIDIDMCEKVLIQNSNIYDSNNDGIDLMESDVLIENVNIFNSKDKGISIGEASTAKIFKTKLEKNDIAVAVKDKSETIMKKIYFFENNTQVSAYEKNLQYGTGGKAIIKESIFRNFENKFYSNKSNIVIESAKIFGKITKDGKNININVRK